MDILILAPLLALFWVLIVLPLAWFHGYLLYGVFKQPLDSEKTLFSLIIHKITSRF
jgi:hypothetical protein